MASVKKNFLYNVGYQILQITLPLITSPYLARILGADGVGTYSYINSIATNFVLFGMLGISNHGSRSIAMAGKDRKIRSDVFSRIYSIQLISASIVNVAFILYATLIAKQYTALLLLQVPHVMSALFDITWLFNGRENFKTTTLRNCFVKITSVVLIFIIVKDRSDIDKYLIIMGMSFLVSQLIMWIQVKKHVDLIGLHFSKIKEDIVPIIVLFVPIIAYTIYRLMDKIMLGSMTGSMVQVGWYENAEKIISIPVGLITALGVVMLPRMSYLTAVGKEDSTQSVIETSFIFASIIAFSTGFGLIGCGKRLALVFFGKEFDGCGDLIMLLACSIPFIAWANVIRTQFLIPKKKDSIYLLSTMTGAILNFCINILLIPILGAQGAVIGSIIAEASVFIVQFVKTKKEIDYFSFFRQIIPYVAMTCLMCIGVYQVGKITDDTVLGLIIQVMLGIVLFCIMLLGYSLVGRDTICAYIRRILKNKKDL